MTKSDVKNIFLNLIDDATKKGIALSETKNADYRVKFDTFLDSAQKYVANIIKIPDVFQVTQNPIPNIEGLGNGFEVVQVLPDEAKTVTLTGCKSMYFEVDNLATITIAINGSVVETITNTVKRSYTAYQKLTGATSTDTVTITYSSSYPFNLRNTGYFEYAFELETDIPVYTPYVSIDMPDNFLEFDSVIIKSDPRIYRSYIAHKWENNRKIVLNYYDKGSFDIHYFKLPDTLAVDAPEDTVLEIESKAIELVALQCAVLATAADNTALSSWMRSLFIEKTQNISQKEQPIMNSIQTVYAIN